MENGMTVIIFILGLIFGSFFNVVGLRIPKKQSIVYPNSHCPRCQHELAWYENIPVVSYLFLRGKCHHCHMKISPIYPVFELITGSLFAFSFVQFGFTREFIIAILFISLLVIITVSDIHYMIIPDQVLLFLNRLYRDSSYSAVIPVVGCSPWGSNWLFDFIFAGHCESRWNGRRRY